MSRVVALEHSGSWSGPARLSIGDEEHEVVCCVSDLQIRETLSQLEAEERSGILLCDFDSKALGDDVLARLTKRRIHRPQVDEMLRELFSARLVDARVLATRPLADALIRGASLGGYLPPSGGTLDLDTAWKTLLRKELGIETSEISFQEILRWTTQPVSRRALLEMDRELRSQLARWLSNTCGDAPRYLFCALDSKVGVDLVAVGLLLGLLMNTEQKGLPEAKAAGARLEQYFGNETLDNTTRQTWYQAAEGVFRHLLKLEPFLARDTIQQLDRLIDQVKLQSFADLSDYSGLGMDLRLAAVGEAILRAIETSSDQDVSKARISLVQAANHCMADSESLRIGRLQMALRLVSWLRCAEPGWSAMSLSQMIGYYCAEGGFVEWAKNRVAESDPTAQVKAALQMVLKTVETRWAGFEQSFVQKLQLWTAQGGDLNGALRIESVLQTVVAAVARKHPVLLVVLDGMSMAVFQELTEDLIQRNWVEIEAPSGDTPRAVLATIPSVTEISRRALLSGQLPLPADGTEKTDFARNDLLFEQLGGSTKPQLFLKGDLLETGRLGLSSTVLQAIENTRCRLVGVVVNAIDDTLGSADQTTYKWTLEQITPLHELLHLTAENGRIVILTSDHGHVLDGGSQVVQQPLAESGDRYRMAAGSLSDGEMEFKGPRIRAATKHESIITLAAQRLRYQGKRRGYHGGVLPSEMVVPCVVLRSANTEAESWVDRPPYEPDWWSVRSTPQIPAVAELVSARPAHRLTQPQRDLFEKPTNPAPVASEWIGKLFESPLYQEQSQRAAVRGAPPVDQFKRFLLLLDQRNGRMIRAQLAQQLGIPLIRVDGLVQNYRRLLNVDGYDVLAYDQPSETIALNIALLKSQFEL